MKHNEYIWSSVRPSDKRLLEDEEALMGYLEQDPRLPYIYSEDEKIEDVIAYHTGGNINEDFWNIGRRITNRYPKWLLKEGLISIQEYWDIVELCFCEDREVRAIGRAILDEKRKL